MIDPTQGFWSWSLPCGRIAGIDVRIHWTLLVISVFDAFQAIRNGLGWFWMPVLLVIPILSVLLHEFGHIAAARLMGGDGRRIILWALGGAALCEAPPRPLAQFVTAAGGPLVSLLLAALGALASGGWPFAGQGFTDPTVVALCAFTAATNLSLLLFNLLPCYPLDGGRMLRAILWPWTGRGRAVRWTLNLAYVCLGLGAAWAVWRGDFFLFAMALMLFLAVVAEHRLIRLGYDPEFGDDLVPDRPARGPGWWARRKQARAERQADADRAELDRLLAKVSAGGLQSLTAAERKTLQAIGARERMRAGQD